MKRKLLAMLTALAMMLTLLPMTAFAEDVPAATSAETALQAALDAGGTVTLSEDVVVTKPLIVKTTVVLNLNGKTISNITDIWQDPADDSVNDWSLISVKGGNLTINGEGTLKAKENDCYAVDICDGGTCVINGGEYIGNVSAVYVNNGSLTINGGKFSIQQKDPTYGTKFTINCLDASYASKDAKATIIGGTFVDFDPSSDLEGDGLGYIPADSVYTYNASTGTVEKDDTKPAIASVNGIEYTSLKAAITAADDGDTVTLLESFTTPTNVFLTKNVILDLNNCELTAGNQIAVGISSGSNVVATVKNGKLTGGTVTPVYVLGGQLTLENVTVSGGVYAPVYVQGGEVILKNSTVNENTTSDNYDKYCVQVMYNSKVTIGEGTVINAPNSTGVVILGKDGNAPELTVSGTINAKYYAIAGNGNDVSGTTITINDGAVIESTNGTAIYHPQKGTLNVNGGSITGLQGIQFCAGTGTMGSEINVGGGKITATGPDNRAEKTGDGEIPDGAAISVIDRNYPGSAPNVTINGGEFVSTAGNPVLAYTWASNQAQDWAEDTEHVLIEGGEFSASVAKYVDKKLNYEANDGMYTYHKTLDEALEAAGDKGTVTDLNPIAGADEATVTLIDQGTKTTIKTTVGSEITLPALETVGYNVFIGWVDGANNLLAGGTEITVAAATETYSALYNAVPPYIPPVVSGNTVTTAPASNGYVTVNPANAAQNTVVTVTPVPSQGYVLSGLTVTDVNGMQVPVTANANGTYSFVMPAAPVTVSAAFAPEGPQTWTNPYADVADTAWYADAVAYVSAKGLMTGTSAVMFAPDASTTRAMIWTVLGRMSGASVDGGEPWYSLAQTWAMANGVSDGTNPNNAITREQLAAMLYRFAGEPDLLDSELAGLNTYADSADVSDWAQEAMAWAVSNGIINGIDGKLAPQGLATRAQVAAMLMRYCENVAK